MSLGTTRSTVGVAGTAPVARCHRFAPCKTRSLMQCSRLPIARTLFAPKRSHNKHACAPLMVSAADLNGFPIVITGETADFVLGGITEVNKDNFFPTVHANKDKLVVLDCFTSWCGPCKMIYPKIESMAAKYKDSTLFLKLNCNPENKELGKALQVKVVPTFFIFDGTSLVETITGAKPDKVEEALVAQLIKLRPGSGVTKATIDQDVECEIDLDISYSE
eukprot:CAMPEP_0198197646 /NCGR_PEP_ID=MMETSP1445-20131203/1212_1 /TAXON_ID=36898 /ORGANISM="Pyramimonas sp., Strain CCMP2087" /LENGTH=219 /DNA_ID=CAMNT_0043866981 /DNA_START=105 /DNA_END=764 /DNA_ORIENTATION=+